MCEELQLQPSLFYHWLKQFLDNGAAAFQRPRDSTQKREQQRVAALEQKLRTKNEVLPELMEEHVALKNSWRDLRGQWLPPDTRDQVIDFVCRWSGQCLASASWGRAAVLVQSLSVLRRSNSTGTTGAGLSFGLIYGFRVDAGSAAQRAVTPSRCRLRL